MAGMGRRNLAVLAAKAFATILLATTLFTRPNALLRPAVVALTSKIDPARQDMLMGLSSSFNNVGRAIAPVWAGFVFDVDVNYPYLSGAAILFVGYLISLRWLRPSSRERVAAETPAATPLSVSSKDP